MLKRAVELRKGMGTVRGRGAVLRATPARGWPREQSHRADATKTAVGTALVYAGNLPVWLGAQKDLGMARTAVGISCPRVWCHSTSELAGGVSMVEMVKEQPYRTCEDSGRDITSSRPRVRCYNVSELVVGVWGRWNRMFSLSSLGLLACNATNRQPASDLLRIFHLAAAISLYQQRLHWSNDRQRYRRTTIITRLNMVTCRRSFNELQRQT